MLDLKCAAEQYWKLYDKETTVSYIRRNCKESVSELLKQADMLMNQTFVFQDRWDMEPCRTPYSIGLDTWLQSPNGDEEWVFMLNRHDFLPKLWYAWLLTEDEAYVQKLKWYLFDWIEKNPITSKGTDATRTIDTGIRCMNWCNLILPMLAEGKLSSEEAETLLRSVGEQFVNLMGRYIGKYSLSNWGVLQTTAMCAAYVWYREFLPEEIEDWAWDELYNQLDLQILEDGSHWEQSAMYHVEVLNSCSKVLANLKMADSIGVTLSPKALSAFQETVRWNAKQEAQAGPGIGFERQNFGWLSGGVRVLSRHVLYTADPAGNQLAQCDSDVTDISDVMARSAVLLSGGECYRQAAGSSMDMDSAWMLGAWGIRLFEQLVPQKVRNLSWECKAGGNLFIRSSWERDADFTWLKNSTLGSGHGHADQTHLSLYYRGKPFLTDSGRYTYREDEPLRMQLKNPQAHNVCVIDGESGGDADTSWTFASCAEVLKNYFTETECLHYAEMPFHGVLKNGTPYVIIRKVLVMDGGVWLSVQDVICQGEHEICEYFHLDNAVSVLRENDGIGLQNGQEVLKLYTDGTLLSEESVISKRYNELIPASLLKKVSVMQDRWTDSVLFAGEGIQVSRAEVFQFGKPQPVSQDVVTAWDIVMQNGTQWTFLIWNRETFRGGKMYLCHDVPVYGKTVALCRDGETYRRIRLKN